MRRLLVLWLLCCLFGFFVALGLWVGGLVVIFGVGVLVSFVFFFSAWVQQLGAFFITVT
jgi:hypothetical protein